MSGWVAGAAVVGTIGGALITANATGDAADQQAQGTAASIGEQRRQFDLTRGDYAPYREAGVNALGQFASEINRPTTAADVMAAPGYQFGLQQGQQGIDRKIAASGGRISGAALKAASRFNTNYATTGYAAEDQRRNDRLNRLAALANIGQTATAGSAAAGTAAANNISSALQNQGDAAGAASLAQGNIWGNATNQLAALYGRASANTGSSGYSWATPQSSNTMSQLYGDVGYG